jgi:D-alanine-D-alanine ligase-like ATP-grasp enzyme
LKKKILILAGGVSKERLISLDTGLQVSKELKKNGYKVKISEPDGNLSKILKNLSLTSYLMHYMDSLVKMVIYKPF